MFSTATPVKFEVLEKRIRLVVLRVDIVGADQVELLLPHAGGDSRAAGVACWLTASAV